MKKLLLLGSVVSPCPPLKYGGSERVVYYQAKQLAKHGVQLILIGAKHSRNNFISQLALEKETESKKIMSAIEFIEIGGGTQVSATDDTVNIDPLKDEASRKLRLEMTYLAQVEHLMIERQKEYSVILNNMRGAEALFLPLAKLLQKPFVTTLHLNIFSALAKLFETYQTPLVPIARHQTKEFPTLNYLPVIPNPVSPTLFPFNETPQNYALFIGSFGKNKNPLDAILAAKKANVPLILAGKLSDPDYFEEQLKPHIDGTQIQFIGEVGYEEKLKLYRNAKVFLFPIKWNEPFGLVVTEALACGTPVIAYPNGGPAEIIRDGVTGYLVNSPDQMAKKINEIKKIKRTACRHDVETRFSDEVVGKQYYEMITKIV